jgi:hypothetical protein
VASTKLPSRLTSGRAQAVRVFVQVLQCIALGADVAGAEDIVLCAANADDLLAAGLHLEPAAGLAQRADAVRGSGFGHGSSGGDEDVVRRAGNTPAPSGVFPVAPDYIMACSSHLLGKFGPKTGFAEV